MKQVICVITENWYRYFSIDRFNRWNVHKFKVKIKNIDHF